MIVNNVACEPSVDIFASGDGERHILEISWWPWEDARRVMMVQRMDLSWDDTAKLIAGMTKALERLGERTDG